MAFKNPNKKRSTCFFIGKGMIQMVDACIPLKAVSDIEVVETKDRALIPALVFIVLGVALFLPGGVWQIAGIASVAVGILGLMIGVILNFYKSHYLNIQVHAGKNYIFPGKDIRYVRNAMEVVRDKIANKEDDAFCYMNFTEMTVDTVEEIDMSRLIRDSWRAGDFAEWDMSTLEKCRDVVLSVFGKKETPKWGDAPEEEVSLYSDEEWKVLEKFFERRCTEMGMANELYKPCLKLKECAVKKDAREMHETIKGMHRADFQIVLGEIDTPMKKLLLKVLKMK